MRRLLAGLALCATFVGCVQQVSIIDGEGGAGGAAVAPPSTTIEDVRAACTDLCSDTSCDLWRHFCDTQCNSVVVVGCEAESLAIIECLLAAPAGACDLHSSTCREAVLTLSDCDGVVDVCTPGACVPESETGACSCSGLCGPNILTQDCVQDATDHATCTCYYGDTPIATCEEQTASCSMGACCGEVVL